ncbi:MAG: flagellar hook capping FlgD N-terminal domain-containing protein [bacterium]
MISQTSSITNQSTQQNIQKEENSNRTTLDQDAFFKLLVTQLQHQDPLEPVDNKEFASQMASFSSLEQMQNMNQHMQQFLKISGINQGATLIGKEIEYHDSESGDALKGKVNSISFLEGKVYATLDDEAVIDIESIVGIS